MIPSSPINPMLTYRNNGEVDKMATALNWLDNPYSFGAYSETPFHYLVHGEFRSAKSLYTILSKNSQCYNLINHKDYYGMTPFSIACIGGDREALEIVDYFLSFKSENGHNFVDVNAVDSYGRAPLHNAVTKVMENNMQGTPIEGNPALMMVDRLIIAGANLGLSYSAESTLLDVILQNPLFDAVVKSKPLLMEKKYEIEQVKERGRRRIEEFAEAAANNSMASEELRQREYESQLRSVVAIQSFARVINEKRALRERLAKEAKERERIEIELQKKIEAEKQARIRQEEIERERLAKEAKERERIEIEQQQKIEAEKQARIRQEEIERERLAKERERIEIELQKKIEAEKQARIRQEEEIERERLAKEAKKRQRRKEVIKKPTKDKRKVSSGSKEGELDDDDELLKNAILEAEKEREAIKLARQKAVELQRQAIEELERQEEEKLARQRAEEERQEKIREEMVQEAKIWFEARNPDIAKSPLFTRKEAVASLFRRVSEELDDFASYIIDAFKREESPNWEVAREKLRAVEKSRSKMLYIKAENSEKRVKIINKRFVEIMLKKVMPGTPDIEGIKESFIGFLRDGCPEGVFPLIENRIIEMVDPSGVRLLGATALDHFVEGPFR